MDLSFNGNCPDLFGARESWIIKEFALNFKEINSDEFKKDISQLSEKFSTENKLNRCQQYTESRYRGFGHPKS
jgi:hypothetical protein